MASIESIGSCSLDVDATASESSAEIGGGMESSVSQRTLCSVNVELNNVNGRTRQSSHADSSPVKEKFDERPKQLSYLNISCSVSGYTSYSCYNSKAREGLRSRDNSPARFNVETSKDSGGSLPNGSHRRWSSTDRPDEVGSTECGIFRTVSSSTTTVKSTVTGYNNATVSATVTEDSVVYDTVDEAGKQTKSLIQQRIERLYGPGFLAQGFRFQREKKKVEPNQKSMLAPVPVVCRPTREHPPVFRHLRKNFCEQLTGTVSGDANHNMKTNLGEGRTTIEMKIQQENGCADVPMSNGHHPQEKMETNVIQINGNHLDCATDSKDVSPDLMDGAAFIRVMNEERSKIESLVARASEDLSSGKLPEDVCGRLRAAIGKANLLLSQKFEQFRGLCKKNINQDATEPFPTTVSDLAGFWDMVLIQVGDIGMMFDEIAEMRKNGWIINEKIGVTTVDGEIQEPTKLTRVQPKRTIATPSPKSEEAAKAREESRKRLMEAKRKARLQRMDSNNGNTSIEIFLPEKRD